MPDVPVGSICVWPSAEAVPSGWQVCDGTNGTPDLRDKFVPCVGSTYAVGDTGGGTGGAIPSHAHDLPADTSHYGGGHEHYWETIESNSSGTDSVAAFGDPPALPTPINVDGALPEAHTHTWTNPNEPDTLPTGGTHWHALTGSLGAASASASGECLPPFTALYYIQRLS